MVATQKTRYNSLTNKEAKIRIARKLIEDVSSMHPPGRFLVQDPKTMLWIEADSTRVLAKTRQALREGCHSNRGKLSR